MLVCWNVACFAAFIKEVNCKPLVNLACVRFGSTRSVFVTRCLLPYLAVPDHYLFVYANSQTTCKGASCKLNTGETALALSCLPGLTGIVRVDPRVVVVFRERSTISSGTTSSMTHECRSQTNMALATAPDVRCQQRRWLYSRFSLPCNTTAAHYRELLGVSDGHSGHVEQSIYSYSTLCSSSMPHLDRGPSPMLGQ